jgi:hypothetical protein
VMGRLSRWMALAVAVSAILTIPLVQLGTPRASATSAAPMIKKVVFTGSSTTPVITVTGSGFAAKPAADPNISPAKAGDKYDSECNTQPLQGNGKDGRDYGPTALGVGWGASVPTGYSAGVYVSGSYLDCIGLVVTSYTATKVVLHLGCQYALYTPLTAGDHYLVQVAGVTKSGTVAY